MSKVKNNPAKTVIEVDSDLEEGEIAIEKGNSDGSESGSDESSPEIQFFSRPSNKRDYQKQHKPQDRNNRRNYNQREHNKAPSHHDNRQKPRGSGYYQHLNDPQDLKSSTVSIPLQDVDRHKQPPSNHQMMNNQFKQGSFQQNAIPSQTFSNPNFAYSTSNPPFQNSQVVLRQQAPGPLFNNPQLGPPQNFQNFQSQQPPNQNYNVQYNQPNPQNIQGGGGFPNQIQPQLQQQQPQGMYNNQRPMDYKPPLQYNPQQNQINPQFQTSQQQHFAAAGGNPPSNTFNQRPSDNMNINPYPNPNLNQPGPGPINYSNPNQNQNQGPRMVDPRLNNSQYYAPLQRQQQQPQPGPGNFMPQQQPQLGPGVGAGNVGPQQNLQQPQPRPGPGNFIPQQNIQQAQPQYDNNIRGGYYQQQNQPQLRNPQGYQTTQPHHLNINQQQQQLHPQQIPLNINNQPFYQQQQQQQAQPQFLNQNPNILIPRDQTPNILIPKNQTPPQIENQGIPPINIIPSTSPNPLIITKPTEQQKEETETEDVVEIERPNPNPEIQHPPGKTTGSQYIEGSKRITPPEVKAQEEQPPAKKNFSFFIDITPIASVTAANENLEEKKVESNKDLEADEKSYRILGYDRAFRTQEKNLLEKLQKFLGPDEEKEKKAQAAAAKAGKEIEVEEKKPEDDEFNFESRYFLYNPTQVCFRCKKPGHMEKWCPEEVVLRCQFCLGQHRMEECTQIICFNCNGVGHRNRDCRVRESMTCYRCGKRGHKNTRCGVLYPKDREALRREKKDYNISTKCVTCGNYGHPVCRKEDAPEFRNGYLDELYDEDYQHSNKKSEKSDEEESEEEDYEEGYTKKKLKTDQTASIIA